MKQLDWLRREKEAYGGDLLTKRKERERPRPLSTKHPMHIVLRSTQASGDWSFRKRPQVIERLIYKYARKHGVKVHAFANVGNHIHMHVKLGNRFTYPAFIRALTGAIALAVTRASKLKKLVKSFWDRRPYTRIVKSRRAVLNLRDYIEINRMEGEGAGREAVECAVKRR